MVATIWSHPFSEVNAKGSLRLRDDEILIKIPVGNVSVP